MERIEIPSGYVSEMSAGSFTEPYSFLEAAERAQNNNLRLMSNKEHQSAINDFEKRLPDKSALEALSSLYGNNFGSPGYAGARTMTGTIVEENGTVTNVDYVFGKSLYGPKQYRGKQLKDLLNLARQIQERGEISYIKEFDENTGLPVAISSEPNPEYHNAVFHVSPFAKEIGVVVRGIHHSVGEPSVKYNVAIFPLDYKDIMLGHRTFSDTNMAKLGIVTGMSVALIRELADKVSGGRTSLEKTVKEIASRVSGGEMNRREFTLALGLLSFYLAGCGGGGGSTNPPPPPLPQTFTYSGRVSKRIVNDDSKVGQGVVRLEGTLGTFTGNIDSAGNFSIPGVKAGAYKRTTSDGASDSAYVPQVESVVQIRGNLTGQNYSVIERGANRFGQEFNQLFQDFYSKIAQRSHQANIGMIKWGNGASPMEARTRDDTVPLEFNDPYHYGKFLTFLDQQKTEDTPIFYGRRITNVTRVSGLPVDLSIEIAFDRTIGVSEISDYPILDIKRIVRARNRYNPDLVLAQMPFITEPPTVMRHAWGHAAGYADFNDPNFDSVMNGEPGKFAPKPTINDEEVSFLAYVPEVKSGNTAPDTNP